MKLKHTEMLDNNDIMSHLFLETLAQHKQLMHRLVAENNSMTKEERAERTYSVELFIEGESVDPRKFFEQFKNQYDAMVKAAALELFQEKMRGFMDKVDSVNTILESWAEEVNWDIENPFVKKVEENK